MGTAVSCSSRAYPRGSDPQAAENYCKFELKSAFLVFMGMTHRFDRCIGISKPLRNFKLVNDAGLRLWIAQIT